MDQQRKQNINMKWFLLVWIIHAIIFDGLRYQKMDMTNLIQINSGLNNMEIATNVENTFYLLHSATNGKNQYDDK